MCMHEDMEKARVVLCCRGDKNNNRLHDTITTIAGGGADEGPRHGVDSLVHDRSNSTGTYMYVCSSSHGERT